MKQTILLSFLLLLSKLTLSQFSFSNGTELLDNPGVIGEHAIVVTDLNDDGKDDIVALAPYSLFFQQENDSLFDFNNLNFPDGGSAWGICAGDVDNDGYSDVLYGGYFNGLSLIKRTPSSGAYTQTNFSDEDFMVFLQGVNFSDINNDGNLDIFACHDVGPSRIYLGDGTGDFERDTTLINTDLNGGGENDSGNYGSLFSDVNNDGHMDLYVAKCRQGVSDPQDPRRINLLFINQGDTLYVEQAADYGIDSGQQSWSADFGDIDNDGDMDLLLGQHTGQYVQLFINNGSGSFADATSASGLYNSFDYHVIQSKFADFDNDGYLDIIIAGSSHFMFAHNNGDSTFDLVTETNIHSPMNSFGLGDLNHDGYIDVYCTPEGYGSGWAEGTDSLYLNNGGSRNFINFELEGLISNRDGIGARIAVYSPLGLQIREIRSGESYGIQNSLNAHFGLDSLTYIDSAFIYWPSGIIDQFVGTAANQFIYAIEGAHPVGIDKYSTLSPMILVYPNPAQEYFNIEFKDMDYFQEKLQIQIMDPLGRLLFFDNVQSKTTINTDDFSSGIYLITPIINGIPGLSQKIQIR